MKKLTILLFLVTLSSQAQTLTLEQCREMAISNNRKLKIASGRTLSSRDYIKAYRANFFPKLSATGNYLYSESESALKLNGGFLPTFVPNPVTGNLEPNILMTKPDGTHIFKEYAYMPDQNLKFKLGSVFSAGLVIEQPIYMGGKIRSIFRMASIGHSISQLNEKKIEAELITTTDEAYYNVVRTIELIKAAESYKAVVSELLRQVGNVTRQGMRTHNDLLKVQVRMNEAELKVRQAENAFRLARMNLCHWIGLPLDCKIDVAGVNAGEELTDRVIDITSRPEYAILQQQIALRHQQVRLTKSDYLPQVAISASYNYTNGVQFNDSPLMNSGAFMGGVSIKIPLFHWGEGYNKISAARREVDIAKYELEDVSELMILEATQALNNYDEALLEEALMEKALNAAHENMLSSRNAYQAGTETLSNHLEAQAIWQKNMAELIDAKARVRTTYSNYQKAAGVLLSTQTDKHNNE